MKKKAVVGLFIVLMLVAMGSLSSQVASGRHTIAGTVKSVFQSDRGGTHVLLDREGNSVEVCLGQSGFLEANDWMPRVGDRLEVEGLITQSGQGDPLFVAQKMRQGDHELDLFQCRETHGCCCRGGLHQHGSHCHHGSHHDSSRAWHD